MTDNGSCYKAFAFDRACKRLKLKHIRTRPYTPKTNGKAERFVQTALREWAYAKPYNTSNERAQQLQPWTPRLQLASPARQPKSQHTHQPPRPRAPNGAVAAERLSDKHVARLVLRTALAAGVRGDLPEGERRLAFAGHSLRAGLATAADVEEALVQRQLGHASAEMTRRYKRRRERFRVNLTKAAGL